MKRTLILTAILTTYFISFAQNSYEQNKSAIDKIDAKVDAISAAVSQTRTDTINQDIPAKSTIDRTYNTYVTKDKELQQYIVRREAKFSSEGKEMTGKSSVSYFFDKSKLIMVMDFGSSSDGMDYRSSWYFDNDKVIYYQTRQSNAEGRAKFLVKNANSILTKLRERGEIK